MAKAVNPNGDGNAIDDVKDKVYTRDLYMRD